ncbi:MAG: HlyD family type I secretion periplasmic adaptor subunit, partial [Pseudomonadota bacterium]
DEQGNPYFSVKVELTEDFHAELPDFVELVPGMPANVLIAVGERQAIDYILSPIMDAASLAMREQ